MPDGGNVCNVSPDATEPPVAKGLPRDENLILDPQERFGNGNWDRWGYWDFNHGAGLPGALIGKSRYEFYRYENDNNLIPNNSATGGEDGNPQCSTESATATDIPDRRTMIMAVMNCSCGDPINGNAEDVPVVGFINTFMTEPVSDPGTGMEYLFEFIEELEPGVGGVDGVLLHNIVQIYR